MYREWRRGSAKDARRLRYGRREKKEEALRRGEKEEKTDFPFSFFFPICQNRNENQVSSKASRNDNSGRK
jgi:hypothetical protein